jgi:SAM-dependent methyltransferase
VKNYDTAYFLERYGERDWRAYKPILADIVRHSNPGPMLDIGAGTGLLLEGARAWGLSCQGIEGSVDAITIAKHRCPDLPLIRHILGEPLPFHDETFQTILLNQVIEHIEPRICRQTLIDSLRVLRPGGMIFITSPSRFDRVEGPKDPTHIHLYAPSELRRVLESVGFTHIVPADYPLPVFGSNPISRKLVSLLFDLTHWDRLSATANCRAYK